MKNCPFCGSFNNKVSGEFFQNEHGVFHVVFVRCEDCKARGPEITGFDKECTNEEVAEAYEKWNKQQ